MVTLRLNNTNGSTIWTKTENGTANSNDNAAAILAYNNDVVVVGQISNTVTGNDYVTSYYNGNSGATSWRKVYDFANTNGGATALTVDATGNFAVTGIVNNLGINEYHTLLYNNSGTQQWVNKVSTGLSYVSANPQIAVDALANHFYVCGQKQGVSSDIFVYQITPGGNKTWDEQFNGAQNGQDAAVDLVVNSMGVIYVAGASLNSSAKFDYTTIKISQTPVAFPIDFNNANQPFSNSHYFYPNQSTILNVNGNLTDEVAFYTKFTNPQQFILKNNNLSFLLAKQDSSGVNDTVHRVDLQFIKSNSLTKPYVFDTKNDGVLNYFLTNVGASPITDVKGSTRIMIPNIYSNIDLHYYSNSSGLKMYFVVKPGGNPNTILMNFNGATGSTLGSNNALTINTTLGDFKFAKPQVYNINSPTTTQTVTGSTGWVNTGGNSYQINAGTYNSALPLVIQINQGPSVSTGSLTGVNWSTYFGSTLADYILKSKCDASNNLFVAGETVSALFPFNPGATGYQTTNKGGYDGFLAKFAPTGQLLWSTYIGGESSDLIKDFDFTGTDIYCVGSTSSFSLPALAKSGAFNNASFSGGYDDGFIFQTNQSGNVNNWLTYYGSSGSDELRACKFDASGNLFVTGVSSSSNIPVIATAGQYQQAYNTSQQVSGFDIYDGIIMKFAVTSSALNWATYYGTSAYGNNDEFNGMDIASNKIYVCGASTGANIPGKINNKTNVGYSDGILVKFDVNGSLNTSKYTSGNKINNSVKVNNNKIYTCGQGNSNMALVNSGLYYFDPTVPPTGQDIAVFSVHSISLTTTIHSVFLSPNGTSNALDIQFAPNNIFYIECAVNGNNLGPTYSYAANTYFSLWNGNEDNFIFAFKENNTNVLWETYFGTSGSEGDLNLNIGSIAIDANNKLYLCGSTTSYTSFPLDNGGGNPVYFQSVKSGGTFAPIDGTITRFDLVPVNAVIGIKEFNKDISLGVYPNPTNKLLILNNNELANQNLQYAVYNISGQKVLNGVLKSDENKIINVSELPQGIYILNIVTETNNFSSKFIKVVN